MEAIWKYRIDAEAERTELLMPYGATILSVQCQHGDISLWVKIKDINRTETTKRIFKIYMTGVHYDKIIGNYIGTVQSLSGNYVEHVFEIQ